MLLSIIIVGYAAWDCLTSRISLNIQIPRAERIFSAANVVLICIWGRLPDELDIAINEQKGESMNDLDAQQKKGPAIHNHNAGHHCHQSHSEDGEKPHGHGGCCGGRGHWMMLAIFAVYLIIEHVL